MACHKNHRLPQKTGEWRSEFAYREQPKTSLEVSDNIILQDYYTPHVILLEGRSAFVKARQTNVVNLCCDSRLQNRQMATNVDIPVSVSKRVTGLTK
jgi:hypothetical protein